MELVAMSSDLMPAGKPEFLSVIKYPKITDLVAEHGKKTMLKVLFLLVKDFCSSMNVVRNMNEDQMIEVASMLIDEADNFRLEDYTMFFAMAKRGMLGKIMDRIDSELISNMLDEYWLKRKNAAIEQQDQEVKQMESELPQDRISDNQDSKFITAADGVIGAMGYLKQKFKEWKNPNE